jgi:hypothetical protein
MARENGEEMASFIETVTSQPRYALTERKNGGRMASVIEKETSQL